MYLLVCKFVCPNADLWKHQGPTRFRAPVGRGNLLVRAFSPLYQGVSLTSPREPLKRLFEGELLLLPSQLLRQGKRAQPPLVFLSCSVQAHIPPSVLLIGTDVRHVRPVYHGLYRSSTTVRPKSGAGENAPGHSPAPRSKISA
jgi:hypothetical protein